MAFLGQEVSKFNIIGVVVSIISCVLQLIGFATPFWVNAPEADRHYGLWQICIASTCISMPPCTNVKCGEFRGAQAMSTLAFILLLVGVVLIGLKMFVIDKDLLKKGGAVSCTVGGVFGLIGIILYAVFFKSFPVGSLHFSFAFCVIAAVGGIAGGILSFM